MPEGTAFILFPVYDFGRPKHDSRPIELMRLMYLIQFKYRCFVQVAGEVGSRDVQVIFELAQARCQSLDIEIEKARIEYSCFLATDERVHHATEISQQACLEIAERAKARFEQTGATGTREENSAQGWLLWNQSNINVRNAFISGLEFIEFLQSQPVGKSIMSLVMKRLYDKATESQGLHPLRYYVKGGKATDEEIRAAITVRTQLMRDNLPEDNFSSETQRRRRLAFVAKNTSYLADWEGKEVKANSNGEYFILWRGDAERSFAFRHSRSSLIVHFTDQGIHLHDENDQPFGSCTFTRAYMFSLPKPMDAIALYNHQRRLVNLPEMDETPPPGRPMLPNLRNGQPQTRKDEPPIRLGDAYEALDMFIKDHMSDNRLVIVVDTNDNHEHFAAYHGRLADTFHFQLLHGQVHDYFNQLDHNHAGSISSTIARNRTRPIMDSIGVFRKVKIQRVSVPTGKTYGNGKRKQLAEAFAHIISGYQEGWEPVNDHVEDGMISFVAKLILRYRDMRIRH